MKKIIFLTALIASGVTVLSLWAATAALPTSAKLENARVKVTEVTYLPGVPRERHIRASDQVIVFLEDCSYERIDPATKARTVRERKSGEVIWHDKGEDAPQLTNLGTKPYRTLLIELK